MGERQQPEKKAEVPPPSSLLFFALRQARPKGAHTQSERRADGARKKRCAILLTRSKELFQPDARSDLLLLGPGLRPGRCGRVVSPEGVGRGSRNPRPPPLAQRSARRSKLDSGRCSCFHPTTVRPYGPARPFERSFWKGNAQFSAPCNPNGTNGFNEITISRYPPKTTKSTVSTKSRFHGPQRNHETNETHEKNETPGKKAFRCFRCVCINRDFVGNVAGADMLLMTLRLPVALSVSFADSSPTGGAKSTPVGAG